MGLACVLPSRSLNTDTPTMGSDMHPEVPVGNSNVQPLDGPMETAHVGWDTNIPTFLETLEAFVKVHPCTVHDSPSQVPATQLK